LTLARQPSPETLCLFTGKRGSGKSHRARAWVADVARVAVFDPKGEYTETLGGPRLTVTEFARRAEVGAYNFGLVRVSVGDVFGREPPAGALADDFEAFCAACWRISSPAAPLLVGVEEISLTGATANVCPPQFASVVNVGRSRGLAVFAVAQRAAMIPAGVRDQASEWFAFSQTRKADADACADMFGDGAPDVRRLQKYHCVHWTAEGGPTIHGPE
jgi:hypothetical protein